MDELYLSGYTREDVLHLPTHSASVLFLLRYTKSTNFKVFLVSDENGEDDSPVHLPLKLHPHLSIIYQSDTPTSVSQCVLPAVRCHLGNKILSGLCGVLRNIVKTAGQTDDSLITLLAHKGICLKACAEVSMWTRYCEVELPAVTQHILQNNCTSKNIMLAPEILKLENQFKQPCAIFNIQKRLRLEKKRKSKSNIETEIINGATETENEALRHDYVEGPDLTLADLALLPCVLLILDHWKEHTPQLEQHLKLTFDWLTRLSNNQLISDTVKSCGLQFPGIRNHTSPCGNSTFILPSGDIESYSVREVKKKKFKATLNQVNQALAKMEAEQISLPSTHPCSDVRLPWADFPDPVHPKDGELPAVRLSRKCEQLENLAQAVVSVAQEGHIIVDFCAGGGHLGILLAYLLPQCQVLLVENKEESIQRADSRIHKLGLTNITIYQCNLDYYRGRFDIGVTLHACGVATDLVMQACLDHSAAFVICPCCYGGIQNTHTVTYPRSEAYLHMDLSYEEYLHLGHGADQTEFKAVVAKQGRQCMLEIDRDRASLATEHGYSVILTTLQPPSCSPKHNLLIGSKVT